jgi:hypothetical protein
MLPDYNTTDCLHMIIIWGVQFLLSNFMVIVPAACKQKVE